MKRLERPLEPHDFVGLISANPVIVEIGAYDGYHTKEFFKHFRPFRYFSFEPDSRALTSYIHQRDSKRWKNYRLYEAAISDQDGTADFHFSHDSRRSSQYGGSSSLRRPKEHLDHFKWCTFPETRKVTTMRLDTWREQQAVAEFGPFMIDLIWADTQGAENMLIAGGSETLNGYTKLFYTEVEEYEMYEGQTNLAGLVQMLPQFRLIGTFESNALFAHRTLAVDIALDGWTPRA